MANGTDSEEFVVLSNVRPGLKRELAFALKAQSEICGGSLGRTRSRKSQSDGPTSPVSPSPRCKRLRQSSDGTGKGNGGAVIVLGLAAGKAVEKANAAARFSEALEGDKFATAAEAAPDLMSEEEAKSDVFDLEDEAGRTHSPAKVAANADNGVVQISQPGDHSAGEKNSEVDKYVTNGIAKVTKENDLGDDSGKNAVILEEDNKVSVCSVKPPRRFTRSALIAKVEEAESPASGGKAKEEALRPAETSNDSKLGNVIIPSEAITTKLEMKMSKKIGLRHPFVALKDFLETGLLEGYPVKYFRSVKGLQYGRTGLEGIIRGSGILCSCHQCKGDQVVSPTIYELHAGSSNKRPSEYIFLGNGKTLRDVMNAVKDSPLEKLEEAVQDVLGTSYLNQCSICVNCRESITPVKDGAARMLCQICVELRESYASPCRSQDTANQTNRPDTSDKQTSVLETADQLTEAIVVAEQSREVPDDDTEWTPVPCHQSKSSVSTLKGSASKVKGYGKLTRKDLRLHKLVFEDDVLPDGTEVSYYAQGKKKLVGYKRGYGIFCSCCEKEVSASVFEAHAGFASRRKPYLNIYTSNGVSLHELSINLAKNRKLSTTENDDMCNVCRDGGDLLCCDTCPRAFHLECIGLPRLPTGAWSCANCVTMFQKESFVERNANALAAGRVAGADAIQQITNRCIRIVNNMESGHSGCYLCKSQSFVRGGFGPRTVIICDLCEKEFHVGCLKEHKIVNLKEVPEGDWFCCKDCERMHSELKGYVDRGEEKLPGSLLDVIMAKLEEKGETSSSDLDISWRILNYKMDSSADSKRLLRESTAIFHERFDPISESDGSQDLIPAMVNGRECKGQDFSGMFCIILLVNQEVVSAGLFRIFGDVAELPLVATSSKCQGLGYFQSLFACLERLLASFHVKKLMLPAAEVAESIWTKKFGFDKISPDELRELRGKHHMMIFQGTSVLQKPIPQPTENGGL